VRLDPGGGTADDPRLESDDPVRDGPEPLADQKMVAVGEGNDRVGCFLDALDQIGIEIEFAPVEPGQLDHGTRLP